PYGFAPNLTAATINLDGNHMSISLPSSITSTLGNESAYALKTVASEGDYDRSATMQILRADGHYKFDDHNISLDFGLRQGSRTAENQNFALIAPVYGGQAYYNPV